ncbi:TldD/PmbA family protein [Hydrogenivirga sp. 128-5-R1-1]|uniref:TldD/PmbA family protein n=1 Tax=Hydrogenivirga sp. 128-5-R1-1 TaxID=392423 RepID=UPI00015F3798|nr:TldD/PmbA family protein [Hydrogenivirga sp. 128-5-R1-1]EDP76360.1 peptide maturation [Hydrogenivirga sp. 128-5-R1-1]
MKEVESLVKKFIKPDYEYEIFLQRTKKIKVEVSDEKLENLSSSEEFGVGLRVLKEERMGFSYTTQIDEPSVKDIVEKAMQVSELQNPDRGNRFLKELKISSAESVFDKEGVELSLEDKIDFTLDLERRAKSIDSRIKGVRKAGFTEGVFSVEVTNSFGVEFGYEGTYFTAMIAALAQEGEDSAISWEFRGERRFSRLDADDIARDVVFKSTSLLNPSPIDTRVMPVVFFRESFAMLMEAFSSLFLGDALVKGKTLLKGHLGESVASEELTLIDDGTLEEGFLTTPYDAEGVPRRKNIVIDRGEFKGFLHSLYTATLAGEEPTGNSERSGFRSLPSSGVTNLYVKPGDRGLEELLSAEKEVFLVIDLMGLHTADPVSGEFSLGASGVLFREGKPVHAVRGVTVAGNILDLWNKIVAVGSDLKFYGNVGSPSVLVADITVGGS